MLYTMAELLKHANEENYAVAAPNVQSEIDARACIEAAEELNAPIILDFAYFHTKDIDISGRYLCEIARKTRIPVALNQDHGGCFEHAIAAIRAGYTSIMVDRSTLPFEENVAQVAELVKVAHAVGVSVEAELGHVGNASDSADEISSGLTEPAKALEFIQRTGIDCLAVAIGTAHGLYKSTPHLDFDRLAEIKSYTGNFPLVLHGGSGSGDEALRKVCTMGINKVNIFSDACAEANKYVLDAAAAGKPSKGVWGYAKEGYKACMKKYIELFGGAGKAWVDLDKML